MTAADDGVWVKVPRKIVEASVAAECLVDPTNSETTIVDAFREALARRGACWEGTFRELVEEVPPIVQGVGNKRITVIPHE